MNQLEKSFEKFLDEMTVLRVESDSEAVLSSADFYLCLYHLRKFYFTYKEIEKRQEKVGAENTSSTRIPYLLVQLGTDPKSKTEVLEKVGSRQKLSRVGPKPIRAL